MPKTAHENLIDRVVKGTVSLERVHEGLQQQVYDLLTKTEQDIVAQIINNDPTYPVATTWQRKRLLKLLANVNDTIDVGYTDIKKTVAKELKKLSKVEAAGIVQGINSVVGADIVDVTLTAQNLEAIVTTTLIDGQTIGKWWGEQSQSFRNKFGKQMQDAMEQIQLGLVRGEAIGELVKRVRGSTELPGMMKNAKREATALVRTSVMQTANESRKAVYKANEDLIKGYEVIATLDARTSPLCRALDRKLYDKEFKPIGHSMQYPGGPPFHWNCRSTLVPVLKSYSELQGPESGLKKKQLTKLDKLDESQRASMQYVVKGGQIVDKQGTPVKAGLSYDDWLKKQPVAVQKDVLGIKKQKLWKEHGMSMADMVSQKGRALTVDELIDQYIEEAAMAAGKITGKQLMKELLDAGKTDDEVFKQFKAYYLEYGAKGGIDITDDFVEKRIKAYKKWYYKTYKEGVKPPVTKPIPKPKIEKPPPLPKTKPIVPPKPTPTAAIPDKFVPAKTLEEAQERASRLNLSYIEIDEGMTSKQALGSINVILEETEDLYRRFPKLQKIVDDTPLFDVTFHKGTSFSHFNSSTGKVQNLTGLYKQGNRSIELSSSLTKKRTALKIDKGTFVCGKDLRSSFRHEFGHHLQMSAMPKEFTGVNNPVLKFYNSVGKNAKSRQAWAAKNISKYGGTNYREFFAETFSAYTDVNYGIKHTLPKELEKAFEELIGPHAAHVKVRTEFFKKATHRELYNKWFEKFKKTAKDFGAGNITGDLKRNLSRDTMKYFVEWQHDASNRWGRAIRWKVSQMENRNFRDLLKEKSKYGGKLYSDDVRELANMIPDEDYIKIRAATQAYYDAKGIKKVKLYRGTDGGSTGPKYRRLADKLKKENPDTWKDMEFKIDEPPAVGWSTQNRTANSFGANGGGVTTMNEFDPEQVFLDADVWDSFEAHYGEREFIVISDLDTKYKLGNVSWRPISTRTPAGKSKVSTIIDEFDDEFVITNSDQMDNAIKQYTTYLQQFDKDTQIKKLDVWTKKMDDMISWAPGEPEVKFAKWTINTESMDEPIMELIDKLNKQKTNINALKTLTGKKVAKESIEEVKKPLPKGKTKAPEPKGKTTLTDGKSVDKMIDDYKSYMYKMKPNELDDYVGDLTEQLEAAVNDASFGKKMEKQKAFTAKFGKKTITMKQPPDMDWDDFLDIVEDTTDAISKELYNFALQYAESEAAMVAKKVKKIKKLRNRRSSKFK